MEVRKIDVDGKIYDYVIECDDAIETNDMDIEDTQDLSEVIKLIQNNE